MTLILDPYAVLGVSESCTKKEALQAYRQKARETHPDLNKDPQALDRFIIVKRAWDYLCQNNGFMAEGFKSRENDKHYLKSEPGHYLYKSFSLFKMSQVEVEAIQKAFALLELACKRALTYTRYKNGPLVRSILIILKRLDVVDLKNNNLGNIAQTIMDIDERLERLLKNIGYRAKEWALEAKYNLDSVVTPRAYWAKVKFTRHIRI